MVLDHKSSSKEFFKSMNKWIEDVITWQNINNWHYQSFLLSQSLSLSQSTSSAASSHRHVTPQVSAIECKIPRLWKRLLAEFIDFLCLFIVKLLATFILVDFLDIVDWSKYDFDSLVQKTLKLDYNAAMELTSELMIVEFAHRITVSLFEALWIYKGYRGIIGGATPGKKCMNLRVVFCEKITTIRAEPDLVVLIEPGSDLGLLRASIRSFVKNFILTLFMPFTFAFLYFQYNRTGYDILAQSVVIEDPLRYHTNR